MKSLGIIGGCLYVLLVLGLQIAIFAVILHFVLKFW